MGSILASEAASVLVLVVSFIVIFITTVTTFAGWESFKIFYGKEKAAPDKILLIAWSSLYFFTITMWALILLSVISVITVILIKITLG